MISTVFGFIVGNWKKIAIGALLAGFLFVGYQVFDEWRDMSAKLVELEADKARNELVIKSQADTIREMEAEAERLAQLQNDLNEALANAEDPLRELQSLLSRHNLENLAFERPGLIETRINQATRNVFKEIECDTGNC